MNKAKFMRLYFLSSLILALNIMGCDKNIPAEVKDCPRNKPYYPLCSNSVHGDKTWAGQCYASWEKALEVADAHVAEHHADDKRWTGVKKVP